MIVIGTTTRPYILAEAPKKVSNEPPAGQVGGPVIGKGKRVLVALSRGPIRHRPSYTGGRKGSKFVRVGSKTTQPVTRPAILALTQF